MNPSSKIHNPLQQPLELKRVEAWNSPRSRGEPCPHAPSQSTSRQGGGGGDGAPAPTLQRCRSRQSIRCSCAARPFEEARRSRLGCSHIGNSTARRGGGCSATCTPTPGSRSP